MESTIFWDQVAAYNQTTWQIQGLMIVAALTLTYWVFTNPSQRTDRWMKAFLGFAFAWNAVVFFLVFVRSKISLFTGVPLFFIVAALFLVDIARGRTEFRVPESGWKRGLTIFWLVLTALYPLIGWVILGHAYPRMLLPLFPCPLTVFAISLISATPKADKAVFILLLPWTIMGLPKCFGVLDCYEDCILFASGIYGLVILIKNWKSTKQLPREGL
jgi:hypothetical protein